MSEAPVVVRRLAPEDLDAVVAVDAAIVGRPRRDYFERRLAAAIRDPRHHVQFAADREGALAGYVLARRLDGEFGRVEDALRLEVIGVRREAQGRGTGDALLGALARWAREHDARSLRTQASWRDHGMLRFFDHAGFELARHQVLGCDVAAASRRMERDAEEADGRELPESDERASDYSADAADLARAETEVRLMTPDDEPAVARIDRRLTGRDRGAYIANAVREALGGSAVRVSLVARRDGAVAGFVMARMDLGDYGRSEPVAVLDTLGVDPSAAHHGVGTSLLAQLFVNLGALRVERVETMVSREDHALLAFLYRVGFDPSPRLAFERAVG